jgi:3-hydroxybutyrate dehydrogenase
MVDRLPSTQWRKPMSALAAVDLRGRIALVTGSTSGIGRAIATRLAGAGATVVIHGLGDPAEIEALRRTLSASSGSGVTHLGHDLAEAGAAAAMVDEVIARHGRVDILVNNAGIQHVSALESFPPEKWDLLMAVNLTAVFAATSRAFGGMKERGWGRVVNTSSTLGMTAEMNKAAYVAGKHGVIGLTRSTALEGAEFGVTCNAICPGWVMTPLVAGQVEARAKEQGRPAEAVIRDMLVTQPTRRFVAPDEIAGTVLFLCSDDAASITGSAIAVDGGQLIL